MFGWDMSHVKEIVPKTSKIGRKEGRSKCSFPHPASLTDISPARLKLSIFYSLMPRLIILSNWRRPPVPAPESSLFFCVIGNQADASLPPVSHHSLLLLAGSHIVDSHYLAEHLLIHREPQWREYWVTFTLHNNVTLCCRH